MDAAEHGFRSDGAHLAQRLANGGQTGILICGALNVIETDDGNVCWDAQSGLTKGANSSDSRDIIESENRSEWTAGFDEGCGDVIAELRGGLGPFQLYGKGWRDAKSKLRSRVEDGLPAHLRIGTESLALDKCDVSMAQADKMIQGKVGSEVVIEDYVDNAGGFVVAGDGDHGEAQLEAPRSVDCDHSLDRAVEEQPGIFVDEVGAMVVAGDKIEIPCLQESIFDSAQNHSLVAFADFRNQDPDRKTALHTERAGKKVGAVIEFAGGGENEISCFWRDGACHGRAVDYDGNCGGRETEAIGQLFQANALARRRRSRSR